MSAVDLAQALYLLLAALGLSLAVSWAGLPVLGGGAFLAVGAYGTALLGPGGAGWPLGLAVLVSVLLGAVVGFVVAVGASRLDGPPLALATWALAWLVQRLLLAYPGTFGGVDGLTRPAPAHLVTRTFGLDLALTPAVHAGVALALCLLVIGGLLRAARGPGGLDLLALREGPEIARMLGIPVARRRRTVLAATGAVIALAGAGHVLLLGLVEPSDVSPLVSLQLFVAVLLGGTARWWGPVVGVAVLTALPPVADALARAIDADVERSRGVLTALLLLAVVVLRGPVGRRLARPGRGPAPAVQPPDPGVAVAGDTVLVRHDVHVRYDGVVALDGAHIELCKGEVHALIGPNGSGKTTLLKELAKDPHAVRTPQQTVVMPRLAADRQVALGARGGGGRRLAVLRHLLATPSSRLDDPRVRAALQATGLTHVTGADPQRLTSGDQRLLQVARAVATGAPALLLDEPAAGMTADERTRLRAVLRHLAARGTGVLLVEHDMRLVGEVADRVTVLHQGRVLACGTPDQVRRDPAVRSAYLGTLAG
ncbi:MAG: branched-chain amino acid transport system ATP-binding protein livM [Frankiales bacterium]|nr:branched-chain amino acid transport system ATP-binding protein livM [Frankiales bacterium]